MCAHSNPERGAVWLSSAKNNRAQFRQESSNAMLMNFDVFLKYRNANSEIMIMFEEITVQVLWFNPVHS